MGQQKGMQHYQQRKEELYYMKHTDECNNSVTECFPNLVERVQYLKSEEGSVQCMCPLMEQEWENGRIAGVAEGKAEGKAEAVLELLRVCGTIPENLSERILQETNIEKLGKWVKLAAGVHNISAFEQNM